MTRDELIASLTATADPGAIHFEGRNDGSYIDWSCKSADVDGRDFEFGDGDGDCVQIGLSWAEIERVQRALTLLLLNRAAA